MKLKDQVTIDLHRFLFEKFQLTIKDSIQTAHVAGVDKENYSLILLTSLLMAACDVALYLELDEDDYLEMVENFYRDRSKVYSLGSKP
jgi:hypothetical protein